MYRTSNDLRFKKNKAAMQKALIDLALEDGLHNITVKALAERAQINRMTFYSHYDKLQDIICEYADDKADNVLSELSHSDTFDIETALDRAQQIFEQDSEFIRMVYADTRFGFCHRKFLDRFSDVLSSELAKIPTIDEQSRDILAGMLAYGIMFTLIDWARGKFGGASLDEVIAPMKVLIKRAVTLQS